MGHIWSKTRSQCQIEGTLANTLDTAILLEHVETFIRMVVLMICRSSSNMGYVGSKTRVTRSN